MGRVILALLIASFLMVSCKRTEQITVASEQVDCAGVGLQKCYLIRGGTDESWQYLYNEIEGFEYEPGYEYIIEIRKEKVKNPAADQSSYRYIFVREITKTEKISADLPRETL